MLRVSEWNTLQYDQNLCTGCGLCVEVCPHAVFAMNAKVAKVVNPDACMECGACQMNCPFEAIIVDSGVGCAQAMIAAALQSRKKRTTSASSVDACGESPAAVTCGASPVVDEVMEKVLLQKGS